MIIKTIWENNVEIFYTGNPRFFDNLFLELAIALRIQTSIARERAANASNAGHYYFRATMNGKLFSVCLDNLLRITALTCQILTAPPKLRRSRGWEFSHLTVLPTDSFFIVRYDNMASNLSLLEDVQTFKCDHCHRLTDEIVCPSCGGQCRKRKAGDRLVQDALRWPCSPSAKEPKVPKQLSSLVKKCPQWEEKISKLVESNQNYRHFSYKEMEQEMSRREVVKAAWEMLSAKSASLVERIERRATKLDETTSFPSSEQQAFETVIQNSVADFRKTSDKFIFGGEFYVRSRRSKCTWKGLLEMKDNASRLRDHALYEELAGYFNEATSFSSFLANDLPDITKFLKEKATILRQFNLDLQAKGVASATKRANAKKKRDEKLSALSGGMTFVPLLRKFIALKQVRNSLLKLRKILKNA